jgi:hypothetical protein
MQSWTLRVLFQATWHGLKTTQSVEDGIPTEDRGKEGKSGKPQEFWD